MRGYVKRNKKNYFFSPKATAKAIRWLGAYGKSSDLSSMINFECFPQREVACEVTSIEKAFSLKNGLIGLEVDVEKTSLVRCYVEDSYTEDVSAKLVANKEINFISNWEEVFTLARQNKNKNKNFGSYLEGTIVNPVYKAVIIKVYKNSKNKHFCKTKKIAKKIVRLFKLHTGKELELKIETIN